ncbi:MAG: hypothetical protein Unbinned2990contig1001_20 [Prokaryotic dsDNA virus sp.]|nr:MAG: hypothetical protein Unbinned2990contig1001_20 [Prokaryotic dsDNA virus sp.]|tara:strand:+ start:6167 stop:6595 length:429 start_codon:yes stop_codon:yes gene_type:complete
MKLLDEKFFSDLSPNVVNMYRKHIFEDAKDADGKKFKKYSKKYSKAKKSGKLKRQSTAFKNSTAPVLTGDLFRDFKERRILSNGLDFGTVTEGGKVKGLAKLGRNLSSQKTIIPKKIAEFIVDEADEYIMDKMSDNFKNKTF